MTEFAIEQASNVTKVGAVHLGMVGLASTFHTSINEPHKKFLPANSENSNCHLTRAKFAGYYFHLPKLVLPTKRIESCPHMPTHQQSIL